MRTSIVMAAIIISMTINDFQAFPAAKLWPTTIVIVLMFVWDIIIDVFKK